MSKVSIVGGCGRMGLRIALIAANKGHNVTSIDIDDEKINEINAGCLPFVEPGAEIYLEQALKKKTLKAGIENDAVKDSEVIIITLGTPVDSNLNPSIEPVAGVIFDLSEYLKPNQLVIFRNTISPGITGRIKSLIEDKTGLKVGQDLYLIFAPEVLNEDEGINDLANTPQPIGAFDEKSFKRGEEFFKTITNGKISFLTPEEALLAKLMVNMFKYIQAATANEFYLIAENFNASIYKILDATYNKNKKELNIPLPNPNMSGPGMHKEGWFLVERTPFSDLITTAFKINESLPGQVVRALENYNLNKVVILGMTSKVNSDDARSSLSYKLRKALYFRDYLVGCYDPYLPEYSDSTILQNADAVILMTPHDEFKDLNKIRGLVNNPSCLYVDLSGIWQETKTNSVNGLWKQSGSSVKAKR
ncbi:MAG: nucleotide sugar dehydrogenase [Candidatus Melainabacteria bacterium]|nr:nucleotide sugar dehydrogenase [Candidatus Melainabacteria bacterium]